MLKKVIITTVVFSFFVLMVVGFFSYQDNDTITNKLANLVGLERLPNESVPFIQTEMQIIAISLVAYFSEFNEYPQGTRADIAQALLGKNPKQEIILEFSRLNEKQEFLDLWGNPYEINLSPTGELQIISAGPNGVIGDDDDEVLEDNLHKSSP